MGPPATAGAQATLEEKLQPEANDAAVDSHEQAVLSRSSSVSSVESVVPPTTQAWDYPLSKMEKRSLLVRMCELERNAAVHEMKEKDAKYKNLKRRVSTGRVSIAPSDEDVA